MADFDLQFFNSCVPIAYPCTVGDVYTDPCNCVNFFLCEINTKIIPRSCSDGTAFNHENEQCDSTSDVVIIDKLCDLEKPYNRCSAVPGADLPYLQARCTGTATTTPGSHSDNTGAIVAGVVVSILVVALIVVLVLYLKKRGKPLSDYMGVFKRKQGTQDKSEEPYAEIGEMSHPVYKDTNGTGPPLPPDRPDFTLSPALKVSQMKDPGRARSQREEVAYDNPGYAHDDDVIQGNASEMTSVTLTVPDTSAAATDTLNQAHYSPLDENRLESPTPKSYTPLSIYTRGPNPNSSNDTGGVVQVSDNDYQVPRPFPEYCELEPGSTSVS
ncbi:uncharacterized protein LOC124278771 [Haliotis rubra]|uniref:uncharacterized protein LOC124278771 n=1 Tax=Haliotis rubra TaxID=36100 RepID=UPI001EE5B48E|nr:uncharacterized protein LOC124278771 [Haliotis rubra]XP_046570503.1 uncharacterized protein LOC124278771 [Haliotis rubra]